jgi:hypothetical protein
MDRALYPGWAGRADRARLERIGQDQAVGPEVARAVAALEAVNAAVIAAVTVHREQELEHFLDPSGGGGIAPDGDRQQGAAGEREGERQAHDQGQSPDCPPVQNVRGERTADGAALLYR